MKTKDEIKNAIKDIPEDSILEYNKMTDEDDLTVAAAKAKTIKTIAIHKSIESKHTSILLEFCGGLLCWGKI